MRSPRLTLALLLIGASLLAGCATGADRRAFLNSMVGVSEANLVQRLGVPSRTYEAEGHKFLAYDERHTDVLPGGPFFFGGGFWGPGFGYGYGPALPTEVIPRVCETTFDVVNGRVQTWSLRGNACV